MFQHRVAAHTDSASLGQGEVCKSREALCAQQKLRFACRTQLRAVQGLKRTRQFDGSCNGQRACDLRVAHRPVRIRAVGIAAVEDRVACNRNIIRGDPYAAVVRTHKD